MSKTPLNILSFVKSYWNYYLELESHFQETERYVDFDNQNNSTFSIEYIKLLQAICSEVDVVGKEIASFCNTSFVIDRNTNMPKWGYEVQSFFPNIDTIKVVFWGEYELQPWKKWKYELKAGKKTPTLQDKCKTPDWWNSYTAVKHRRTETYKGNRFNYTRANLRNVSTALAGLFVLESIFIEHLQSSSDNNIIINSSKIFRKI